MLSVSDHESDSEHAVVSQSSRAGSGSEDGLESGSESDSLDNNASRKRRRLSSDCLLYTSDAADE